MHFINEIVISMNTIESSHYRRLHTAPHEPSRLPSCAECVSAPSFPCKSRNKLTVSLAVHLHKKFDVFSFEHCHGNIRNSIKII
jgi:hypothetical protein